MRQFPLSLLSLLELQAILVPKEVPLLRYNFWTDIVGIVSVPFDHSLVTENFVDIFEACKNQLIRGMGSGFLEATPQNQGQLQPSSNKKFSRTHATSP